MLSALVAASALAFTPPTSKFFQVGHAGAAVSRRDLLQVAGAAAAMIPGLAFADGANSAATATRARQIYGSRVYRLQTASASTIAEEANAFQLFISGTYRTGDVKPTAKKLTALSKTIVTKAKGGDEAGAKASLKEFIALGKITEQDAVAGGNFNPKQRRNAGAPPTSEIEAQMGTSAFALYQPLKGTSTPQPLTK